MTFNPQKCEFLRNTYKKNPIIHNYYIENSLITEVPHTKYLGVTIDHELSWNKHIQRIANKAVQLNAFLYWNLTHCPINIKCTCYKSMVRSIVEHASPICNSYTITNINKLEAIQRAAARFCLMTFQNYPALLLC